MLIKIYKSTLISIFFSFFILSKYEELNYGLLTLKELKLNIFFSILYNNAFYYKAPMLLEEDIKDLKNSNIRLYACLIYDTYDVVYSFENNDDLKRIFDEFTNSQRQACYMALYKSGTKREIQVKLERICSLRNIMRCYIL